VQNAGKKLVEELQRKKGDYMGFYETLYGEGKNNKIQVLGSRQLSISELQIVALENERKIIIALGMNPKEINPLIDWNDEIIAKLKRERNIQ
jgi:hypothetical protein